MAWMQFFFRCIAFLSCWIFSSLKASLLAFRSTLRSLRNSLTAAFLAFFSSLDSCLFLKESSDTRDARVITVPTSSSSSEELLLFTSWANRSFSRSSCLSAAVVRPLPKTSFGIPVLPEILIGWIRWKKNNKNSSIFFTKTVTRENFELLVYEKITEKIRQIASVSKLLHL